MIQYKGEKGRFNPFCHSDLTAVQRENFPYREVIKTIKCRACIGISGDPNVITCCCNCFSVKWPGATFENPPGGCTNVGEPSPCPNPAFYAIQDLNLNWIGFGCNPAINGKLCYDCVDQRAAILNGSIFRPVCRWNGRNVFDYGLNPAGQFKGELYVTTVDNYDWYSGYGGSDPAGTATLIISFGNRPTPDYWYSIYGGATYKCMDFNCSGGDFSIVGSGNPPGDATGSFPATLSVVASDCRCQGDIEWESRQTGISTPYWYTDSGLHECRPCSTPISPPIPAPSPVGGKSYYILPCGD